MIKYTNGNKVGVIEFKSQQKINADHQRKTEEQLKAFKQRIQSMQDLNNNYNEIKEESLV